MAKIEEKKAKAKAKAKGKGTKASATLKKRAEAQAKAAVEDVQVAEGAQENSGDSPPEESSAPPVINEYDQIYHYMRTIGGNPNPQYGILSGYQLDAEIGTILASGLQIIDVLPAGFSPEGDRVLFVFGRPVIGEAEYEEHHFVRRVIGIAEGAITGYSADTWINHYVEQKGWRILKTIINGTPPEGIITIWILVR